MILIMIKKILMYVVTKVFEVRDFVFRGRLKKIHVWGFELLSNYEHALPRYLRDNPSYAANLLRVLLSVKKKYATFTIVDVGANIGDTVALIRSKLDLPIVCVEGDDGYFEILTKNMLQFKDVQTLQTFLGEKKELVPVVKQAKGGTLSFVKAPKLGSRSDSSVSIDTLDAISEKYPNLFSNVKVIKIDTDGYDLKVLRGGMGFIKKTMPIIFFEYDRFFLTRAGENGLSVFDDLAKLGYGRAAFFDNSGRLLLSTDVNNREVIEQLYSYTHQKKGAFPFFDVCVYSENDDDIALALVRSEVKRNYEDIV